MSRGEITAKTLGNRRCQEGNYFPLLIHPKKIYNAYFIVILRSLTLLSFIVLHSTKGRTTVRRFCWHMLHQQMAITVVIMG